MPDILFLAAICSQPNKEGVLLMRRRSVGRRGYVVMRSRCDGVLMTAIEKDVEAVIDERRWVWKCWKKSESTQVRKAFMERRGLRFYFSLGLPDRLCSR